ncbi:STRUBBELIG-receptor family 8 [Artemisia annua]|uniref:STRUBBELIG-receptor family 8 n=1 Tax=Artemisia annua TaxID=35608 RepID=A0A2U1M406_ARTAN|nr:STRUBBELIG-receptor family 8 [Artemisia annua]
MHGRNLIEQGKSGFTKRVKFPITSSSNPLTTLQAATNSFFQDNIIGEGSLDEDANDGVIDQNLTKKPNGEGSSKKPVKNTIKIIDSGATTKKNAKAKRSKKGKKMDNQLEGLEDGLQEMGQLKDQWVQNFGCN